MPIQTRVREAGGRPVEAVAPLGADAVALPVRPGPTAPADALPELPFPVEELLALHRAKGEPGEIVAAPVRLDGRLCELLLYGVGEAAPADLRKAGAALTRRGRGRDTLVAGLPEASSDGLAAFVEGALLAAYEFTIRSGDDEDAGAGKGKRPPGTLALAVEGADAWAAVRRGEALARAAARARDLANQPSTDKGPSWLAGRAADIAAEAGLELRVLGEKELAERGFGGLLAVGGGSPRPPRLIELSYRPEDADGRHVVLVGKGIAFDSGGLSLKPNDNMKTMKTDMAGGGAVMAVMGALRGLGVRSRVTGLVAAAENMPSGSAMRPGDVITHYGGRTSEVLNTDAEGRLVLADALAYAAAELDPDVIVDVATLTGAAKVALGLRHGALYATDDDLADALLAAGRAAGEPLWRMPLIDEYRPGIDSDVADVANIERRGFGGGSIMAALFLREFAGGRRWAHLDVAGPARATGEDAEITKGATGFGTRLLLTWLGAASG
ncbi:hypothetical protein Arub01_05170 [Actinomadura rubrobrunea]|uniref:Probable cytosol aminopeptidase n=1 Tax=Actinomadura rubrobrunea TaxID=115335 RepID=A0A9W6PSP5_9ACTN|nr:leucyl aminopeptidase [Actinomadura rubrobrunea]GLW62273.1 hypothetical protein Arub01_05170 [Actinomadura rubrobrunea]